MSPITTDGRSKVRSLHLALVTRVLSGDGTAPPELRGAAFNAAGLDEPIRTLVEKAAYHAYRITDDDIAATRSAGLSEDQIFEVVICAAIGQATRQYESGLAAVATATGEE